MGAKLRCEIFPTDLDATADFYVRVLGFALVRDERDTDQPYLGLVRDEARIGAGLVIEVDDLDRCHDQVTTAGWPVDEPITRRPWGLRDFD